MKTLPATQDPANDSNLDCCMAFGPGRFNRSLLVGICSFLMMMASNTAVAAAADLVVENLTRSPSTVAPGANTTLSYRVANRGTTTVTPTFTDRFYLSTNETLEVGTDPVLGTSHGHSGDLAPNATHSHSQAVTIPGGTAEGSYFILVRTDVFGSVAESNEGNNVTSVALTVGTVVSAKDLVIENLAVSPGSVATGGSTTVSHNVVNRGTTTVTETYTDRIYLSTNNTLETGNDTLLATTHGHTSDLAANATHANSQAVTIPLGTTAGSYFILVQADALGAVAESNEGNNVTAVALTVAGSKDLRIENLTRSPSSAAAGGSTTVSYNVANRGTATVTETYTDRIYLSSNSTFESAQDTLLGTSHGHTSDLAPDAIHSHSQSVTIPGGTAGGNYFILVRADALGTVAEGNEGNNVTAVSFTVTGPFAVSEVLASDVVLNRASISWLTNLSATTQVEYGTTEAYGQISALNGTLSRRHVVHLTDLEPGTLYHFRVLSEDSNGNLVASDDETFTTATTHVFQEFNGQVVIEAEHYDEKIPRNGQDWLLRTSQTGYSGAGYLEALPNTGVAINTDYLTTSPELIYNVDFTNAGTYYVWIRGSAPSGDDDTVHAGIDDTGPASADRMNLFTTSFTFRRTTIDGPVATIVVPTAGLHTFHLWMREDGMKVDKILLRQSSSSTVPAGAGPSESDGRPRVMAVGDSITRGTGDSDTFGYRDHLDFLLGVGEQEFVGTFRNPGQHPFYDVDHEGVGGERTDQVEARLDAALNVHMPAPNPGNSRLLLHIGTNDMQDLLPIDGAVDNVEDIIDIIHAHDPEINVYVALIAPSTIVAEDAVFTDYNTALAARIGNLQATKSNLFLVDINSAFKANPFWATEFMVDSVHPNDTGYAVMAEAWAESIAANE